MYEELVKRLRCRANGSYEEKCEGCEFTEDFPPCVHCTIKAFNDAADAIEVLANKLCDWCGVCSKERRRPWDCEIMWPNAPIPEVYIEPPKEKT